MQRRGGHYLAAKLDVQVVSLFRCIDQAGLLWLLNGAKLVILAEDAATIETRTGARQSFRRKPCDPGRVLAWELAR